MNKLIEEFKIELLKLNKDALKELNEGCDEVEIKKFEEAFGVKLDEDYKTLLLTHNGESGYIQPFLGLNFMSLDLITMELETSRDIDGSFNEVNSSDIKKVKNDYLNNMWVPFCSDGGGNFFYFDYDPNEEGCMGQIITGGCDEDDVKYVCDNFIDFFKYILVEYKNNNLSYEIEDEMITWREYIAFDYVDEIRVFIEKENQC